MDLRILFHGQEFNKLILIDNLAVYCSQEQTAHDRTSNDSSFFAAFVTCFKWMIQSHWEGAREASGSSLILQMNGHLGSVSSLLECRPVARQRPWNKHLNNSHCWVKAPQISMFPRQRENTAIMEETFPTRSVPRCNNQNELAVAVRKLLVFSRCELLLLEASSWDRGQFGLPEEGERPPLEAAIKQRQWRCDRGHWRVCKS
jgi:hypothetical protein